MKQYIVISFLSLFFATSFGESSYKKLDEPPKADKPIYVRLELIKPDSETLEPIEITIQKNNAVMMTYPDGQPTVGIKKENETLIYNEPIEILYDQSALDWYFVMETKGYFKEKISVSQISDKYTKMIDAGDHYIIPMTIYVVSNRDLPKMYEFTIHLKFNLETKEFQNHHFNPNNLRQVEKINYLMTNTMYIHFDMALDKIKEPEDLEGIMQLSINEADSDSGFFPSEFDYPLARPMVKAPSEGYTASIPLSLGDTRKYYYFKIFGRYGRIQINQVYFKGNELNVLVLCKINQIPNIIDIRNPAKT